MFICNLELFLYSDSILSVVFFSYRVRHLRFHGEREEELDDILLMVSAFGLFAYAIFSAVAGSLSAYTEEPNLLVMVTSCLSILQVSVWLLYSKEIYEYNLKYSRYS